MSCDLFIFAGEKSGDLYGEKLLTSLLEKKPDLNIYGVAGPLMRSKRIQCILPMEEFQVMGFIDVFVALPKLIRQFYWIANEILRLQPAIVVTIDYPGFNLRLVKYLKKKGFKGKCIHFICPSVWAWGKKRIPLMAENLDKLLSILPFEQKFFAHTPLPVSFVGHPLIEKIASYTYKEFPFPKDQKLIALFPGSRKKEVERNLPLYLDLCSELIRENPSLCIALSVSEERLQSLIEKIVKEKGWENRLMLVPASHSYELMRASYIAIAKSGTVTLELALHRIPTVVTYGVTQLDLFIVLHLLRIRLPFYCLVNIIAEKQVFTELFGPRFTLDNLRKEVEKLFDPSIRTAMQTECALLIDQLGKTNAAERAAKEILN